MLLSESFGAGMLKMRILFVLPSSDTIYGSGRCVRYLANSLHCKYDIIVGKSLIHKVDIASLRESFSSNLEHIYAMWLPNYNAYYGRVSGVSMRIAEIHKYIAWIFSKKIFDRTVKSGKYDIIHLNSMILAPMLSRKYKMIIHIREVYEGNERKHRFLERKLRDAYGLIYINPSVRSALGVVHANSVMIQDPFDMRYLEALDRQTICQEYNISESAIIFSILGRFEERNGTEFIINTIRRCKRKDILLLVVGAVSDAQREKCTDLIQDDERIRILGELKEPGPIFSISDYIIRGEAFFAGFGRTLYEGLYSGCHVIYPGDREKDSSKIEQYKEFSDRIHFYPPRDMKTLCDFIDNACTKIAYPRDYRSNIEAGVRQYMDFIGAGDERE